MDLTSLPWAPAVLIVLGFLLLAAELFLPTSGILSILSVLALALGVWLAFVQNPSTGIVTLLVVFVLLPVVGGLLLRLWPKTRVGRHLFLTNPEAATTAASLPIHAELEQLVGRFGRTVSTLRPSGVTDFDGRRVDTITEGMMIEPGQWVRCVEVRGGKVVVRPATKPDLGMLESADFS
jgi:membrane-bound serine protease (ClpP class)